jgi:hypothetical protein
MGANFGLGSAAVMEDWMSVRQFQVLYTVKNAVELLGPPSRNSVLMLKKYNITDEIVWLSSHVFFFYPAN